MRIRVTIKRGLVKDGDWEKHEIVNEEFHPADGFNVGLGEMVMKEVSGIQIIIEKEEANANVNRSVFDSSFYRGRVFRED